MNISVDPTVDSAYIALTPGARTTDRLAQPIEVPDGVNATVVIDWCDGRLVGLEVLGATDTLPPELLAGAPVSQ